MADLLVSRALNKYAWTLNTCWPSRKQVVKMVF